MCHMVEKFNSVSPFFLNSQQYVFTKISLLYIQLKPQIELKGGGGGGGGGGWHFCYLFF